MRFSSRRVGIPATLILLAAPVAGAQQPDPHASIRLPSWTLESVEAPHPAWLTTLSSALLPGTGQLLRGQDRGVVYLIAEAFFLERFISLWSRARGDEAQYRDLAFRVARAGFAPTRADTVFEYFEQMGVFVESGAFDTDPGPALVPPTDESSYNGHTWALARETFFPDPDASLDTASVEYRTALDFYRRRAVGPNFYWSWRTAVLERDLFRQSIVQGDDAFRRASAQLGLLLANHFLSMVDAFVSQRLARRGAPIKLSHGLRAPFPGSLRVEIGVSIRP